MHWTLLVWHHAISKLFVSKTSWNPWNSLEFHTTCIHAPSLSLIYSPIIAEANPGTWTSYISSYQKSFRISSPCWTSPALGWSRLLCNVFRAVVLPLKGMPTSITLCLCEKEDSADSQCEQTWLRLSSLPLFGSSRTRINQIDHHDQSGLNTWINPVPVCWIPALRGGMRRTGWSCRGNRDAPGFAVVSTSVRFDGLVVRLISDRWTSVKNNLCGWFKAGGVYLAQNASRDLLYFSIQT